MLRFSLILAFLLPALAFAGESAGTYAFQPLNGLSSEPVIARVYCDDHSPHSGIPPFALIAAPNIPPTNSPAPIEDHNLLSASHVTIAVTSETPLVITIDARKCSIPRRFEVSREALISLAKEAISLTAKEWKIPTYQIAVEPPL